MEIRRRPPNPTVRVENLEYAVPHREAQAKNILEEIVWHKDIEIKNFKKIVSLEDLIKKIEKLPTPKDFYKNILESKIKPGVIAEIKKASPSKGVIRKDFNPKEISKKENFTLGVVKSFFKANSKALAELESDGLLKLIFNKDNGKVLGAHIFGLHAADLIQEISNAISRNQDVIELSKEVHTHPTLSEVVEVAYKQAASQIK